MLNNSFKMVHWEVKIELWEFKMLKMGLCGSQGAPKEDPVGPRRGSKEPKLSPRWLQGRSKRTLDGLKGPKATQREPEASPNGAQKKPKRLEWS